MGESQWKGLWERDGVVLMKQSGGLGETVLGGSAWARGQDRLVSGLITNAVHGEGAG